MRKFTQRQIACILGCSQTTVSQWRQRNSLSDKNTNKLKKITLYLNILTQQPENKQAKCASIRRDLGLTGAKVASFLGVTASTISRWEKGELPKDTNLTRIKEAAKSIKSMFPSLSGSTKAA